MFLQEDNTFHEIRRRSLLQWLDEMEQHEDVAVRGGVRLCREYMQFLMDENEHLKSENQRKNQYLKKMAKQKRQK